MAQVKIQNTGPNPLVLRAESGTVTLEVGACHVDKELLGKILSENRIAKLLFEAQCRAWTEQVEGTLDAPPPGPVVPISKLTLAAAKKQIAKCQSVEVLRRWQIEDAREGVQKALVERWKDLVPAEGEDVSKIEVR